MPLRARDRQPGHELRLGRRCRWKARSRATAISARFSTVPPPSNDVLMENGKRAVRDARGDRPGVRRRRVQHGGPPQSAGAAELRRRLSRASRSVERRRPLRVADGLERQQRRQRGQARLRDVHGVAQHAARGRRARLPARACGTAARRAAVDVRHRRRMRTRTAGSLDLGIDASCSPGALRLATDAQGRVAITSPRGAGARARANRPRRGGVARRAEGRGHERRTRVQRARARGSRSSKPAAARSSSPMPGAWRDARRRRTPRPPISCGWSSASRRRRPTLRSRGSRSCPARAERPAGCRLARRRCRS